MQIKKTYTVPQTWAEQPMLENAFLLVSGNGEDLVGEDFDAWSVSSEFNF